jgi:hypothetical protein
MSRYSVRCRCANVGTPDKSLFSAAAQHWHERLRKAVVAHVVRCHRKWTWCAGMSGTSRVVVLRLHGA